MNINTQNKSFKSIKQHKHFLAAFILLICISIYVSHANKPAIINLSSEPVQADTILPKGFILYPIVLENIEAIKGVIDQYGVIDVYLGSKNGAQSKKLLSKVKIMQAPFNPNEYALLLPEHLSQKMMSASGPFLGVIQNRTETADFIEQHSNLKIKKINIEYQKGS